VIVTVGAVGVGVVVVVVGCVVVVVGLDVVVPWLTMIFQDAVAGVGSGIPVRLRARTLNVWEPVTSLA